MDKFIDRLLTLGLQNSSWNCVVAFNVSLLVIFCEPSIHRHQILRYSIENNVDWASKLVTQGYVFKNTSPYEYFFFPSLNNLSIEASIRVLTLALEGP